MANHTDRTRKKGLDTTTETAKIRGQQRRLWRRDNKPEELAKSAEALAEEYEPKDWMAMTEASVEEAEETTRPSERLQRRRRRCVYGPRELTTTTAASEKEDGPKESETTVEVSSDDEE